MKYIVSRHPATISWIKQQTGITKVVEHLDVDEINQGDEVYGNLPVHMAAEICQKQAKYFHLSLCLHEAQRGTELTLEQLEGSAKLQQFYIKEL